MQATSNSLQNEKPKIISNRVKKVEEEMPPEPEKKVVTPMLLGDLFNQDSKQLSKSMVMDQSKLSGS